MKSALQAHIAKHALSYVIALLLGLSNSLVAVYDNFWSLEPEGMAKIGWWQVLALIAKCSAAFTLGILGYLMKSPLEKQPDDQPAPAPTQ